MHTLRLNVNEKVYDKLLRLLSKFSKDEIEIISESSDLLKRIKEIPSNPYKYRKSIYFEHEHVRDLIFKGLQLYSV